MTDRIADPWGKRTPYAPGEQWPARVDQHLQSPDVDRWVRSACVLCTNGCGVDIAVKDGRIVGVRGRADDRASRGRLGPKGLFGWQANHSPDRLTTPLVRRNGKLVEADWDTALDLVVEKSRALLASHGPNAFAFYNTGQLFLEEYYTLATFTHAGLGTPHVDGNTRLCTATAAHALRESFAMDGQPGTLADVDHCDTLFLVGYNVAETQTVFWMRMLDRLEGPAPPRLVVVDPRPTVPARRADVHLPIKPGTNVALLDGIQHELIRNGWIDRAWVDAHTLGFEKLAKTVADYPPERVAGICEVPADRIREAARVIGEGRRVLSACLQGVYQSNQATAAAVQINNIQLLRGMIGKPGCGVIQSNGQPTAQNARETGCDGEMPGFRNWQNPKHMQALADVWNVDLDTIPHWHSHTHALQMFRYAEEGSVRLLWVIGTNPAMSLPELRRIRSIMKQDRLFLVVQDAFLTETARLADVVLPAAIWGEKTGTFTNADRTVHLSEKAVEPPGRAKPDLDIFLDYARRMDFRDKDGAPLVKWSDPEGAFEAWKVCSAGRPCDYSGMSYAKLRGSGGIQWPCNAEHPDGVERLYADGRFFTDPEYAQEYLHDLDTGGTHAPESYKAMNPAGRAFLREAEYLPPLEETDDAYPLTVTTGRTVYHFHTRTKTARAAQLNGAAPDAWIEISAADAARFGVHEGDWTRVETPRGEVVARARVTDIRPGVVFVPFHYGYWDANGAQPDGRPRAANELTLTAWDPVSKQPYFKGAKARVSVVQRAEGRPAPAPTTGAARPVQGAGVPPTAGGPDADATETT